MLGKKRNTMILLGLFMVFTASFGVAAKPQDGFAGAYLFLGAAGCLCLLAAWVGAVFTWGKEDVIPSESKGWMLRQAVQGFWGRCRGKLLRRNVALPCLVDSEEHTILVQEKDLEEMSGQLVKIIRDSGKRYKIQYQTKMPDGTVQPAYNHIEVQRPVRRSASPQKTASLQAEKRVEARFSLAHDSLTGLLSKASMMSLIGNELTSHRQGEGSSGLFVLDINNYRVVNTRYGYSVGDQVLGEVGRRLSRLASPRVLVGRIESNNFVVFIKDLHHQDEMAWMARQIQAVFERPINIGTGDISITASMGAAFAPSAMSTLDSLMGYAFTALAHAKNQGQGNNYQLFNSSMKHSADRRASIIRILENHQQTGSLRVYYQPQYISENGCIHGLEALLRVVDSQLGLVAPKEFIPIAEETGLIIDIGYWCVRECCRAVKRFRKAGLLFTAISVNVSLVQLTADDFVERIKSIVREEGVDPSLLAVEITESMLMCSMEHGEELLRQLKEFGVRVVLDDFGSGYSSLNYIRALSVDTLKIDKSFIDGICTDEKSKYIIELILNLAEKINLEVVAEGVETAEQLDMLRSFACPIIQGFYFSKPVPEAEVIQLFGNGA